MGADRSASARRRARILLVVGPAARGAAARGALPQECRDAPVAPAARRRADNTRRREGRAPRGVAQRARRAGRAAVGAARINHRRHRAARRPARVARPATDPARRFVAARAARGCARPLALYRVAKQQASRRLLPHRKQFFALAAELLPRLQPLRVARTGALLEQLAQMAPDAAAAWLAPPPPPAVAANGEASPSGAAGSSGGGGEGLWLLKSAVALCKARAAVTTPRLGAFAQPP